MKDCLTQHELCDLLNHKIHQISINDDLANRCILADQWSQPIGVLTYLLARVLENNDTGNKEDCVRYIEMFYYLSETMYLEVQEIDHIFITTLLNTLRQPYLTIEDELVELHTTMMNHDYHRVIRY